MGEHVCFLLYILDVDGDRQFTRRVAVRFRKYGSLPGDCCDYPMEPENRQKIYDALPNHMMVNPIPGIACPIVHIEVIDDIETIG